MSRFMRFRVTTISGARGERQLALANERNQISKRACFALPTRRKAQTCSFNTIVFCNNKHLVAYGALLPSITRAPNLWLPLMNITTVSFV